MKAIPLRTTSILSISVCVAALLSALDFSASGGSAVQPEVFRRVASFPVYLNSSIEEETVAEIITSSVDGNWLIYTDGVAQRVGFIDITDPLRPKPGGVLAMGGEPTSITVLGGHALAAVNTSLDYVQPSGDLVVIDIDQRKVVRRVPLGGQPDSIAVSKDGRFAAIAIENERDEEANGGALPQLPGGYLSVVDLEGSVAEWSVRQVELTGLAELYPEDPEPEFVDINAQNQVVISLQENNHLVVVNLEDGAVIHHFSAGYVDLDQVDTLENGRIELTGKLRHIAREPDSVAWTSADIFYTADEGDMNGGSRGFTGFDRQGAKVFESGNTVEHIVARHGHYPESRSENKGSEPEGLEYGDFGDDGEFLFVGCERANVVLVYELNRPGNKSPQFVQCLPTCVGPEGLLAIPQRGLFIAASEKDAREDGYRSTVTIYSSGRESNYPTVIAESRADGTPIGWGSLSGLAAGSESTVYAVHDGNYDASRIYSLQVDRFPAVIQSELVLRDTNGVLMRTLNALRERLPDDGKFKPKKFVNDDGTLNLDLEGIAAVADGFWVVSEGKGFLQGGISAEDEHAFKSPNMALKLDPAGVVQGVILLRSELSANQSDAGFEGVAVDGGFLYVAFQGPWPAAGDPAAKTRIGRYPLEQAGDWQFAYYPLDAPTAAGGGKVSLSELTALGSGEFAVIERDNRGGTDASIKRIYRFDAGQLDWRSDAQISKIPVVEKQLVRDLLLSGDFDPTGSTAPEKVEGLCVSSNGHFFIVNDNDGVDESSGETQLLDLGALLSTH